MGFRGPIEIVFLVYLRQTLELLRPGNPAIICRGDEELLVDPEMGGFEVVQTHDFIEVCFVMLHDFP